MNERTCGVASAVKKSLRNLRANNTKTSVTFSSSGSIFITSPMFVRSVPFASDGLNLYSAVLYTASWHKPSSVGSSCRKRLHFGFTGW